MAAAKKANNAPALAELNAIAPYAVPGKRIELQDGEIAHKWSDYFGGVMAYRTSQEDESHAARLSPDYTDAEARHIYDGNDFSERYLLADVFNMDLRAQGTLECPMIMLLGRHDRTVNSDVAREWFGRLKAPEKHLVWFENSAHEPESEEPGKFLLSLVRYARPIAERAADAP
jgi:pimeloyl-ACP methyl ester carboxylesterase